MAVLTLNNVTYKYPLTTQPVLKNISFTVEEGQFVAIVGPNGAGKSTLCYAIAGFVPHFYKGEITHDIDFCAENFARVIALAQGQVLLNGLASDVLGQEEILSSTYVQPPQLTRLGQRLDLPVTIRNQAEFLEQYRKS